MSRRSTKLWLFTQQRKRLFSSRCFSPNLLICTRSVVSCFDKVADRPLWRGEVGCVREYRRGQREASTNLLLLAVIRQRRSGIGGSLRPLAIAFIYVGSDDVKNRCFPEFRKQRANRIAKGNQATPGVEGYVFDGLEGSQMVFWTCAETAASATHTHEFDEYLVVIQGCYALVIDGKQSPVRVPWSRRTAIVASRFDTRTRGG